MQNNISSLKKGTLLKSPTQEYRIEEVLGAGSFGITYLASSMVRYGNVSFKVKFAIKEHFMESCYRDDNGITVRCTPASEVNVKQSREDFLNEARRLQDICRHSQNIVKVNEAFEANGTAYYVMEYLDGGRPSKMNERDAVNFIAQVASAVEVLHENKFLHLDIKPDNIVLKNDETGKSYPVLIDFGITKHFDEKGNPTSTPNAKGISQGYAPVEQNDVITKFAPTLDIYALGATLLYLLTGKNPPSSVKLIDPSQKELAAIIPSDVSDTTRKAILKAMAPNKSERTGNVSQFLKDLKVNTKQEYYNFNSSYKDKPDIESHNPTDPLGNKKKKKRKSGEGSDQKGKTGISYWVLLASVVLFAIGWVMVESETFLFALYALLGIAAAIIICYLLEKATKIKMGISLPLIFVAFLVVCLILHTYSAIYVVVIEMIVAGMLLYAFFGRARSDVRWILSALFLLPACFLFYLVIYDAFGPRPEEELWVPQEELVAPEPDEYSEPEIIDSLEYNPALDIQ